MPVRCAVPVFAATTTLTLPLPVPVPLPPTVSQAALLNVLQAHADPVVIATAVVSPAAGEVRTVGAIPKEHAVLAACVTEKGWPAIVMVPVRLLALVFPATTTETLPLPVPEPPDRMISQFAWLDAVQAQVLLVVTATAVVSPIDGELRVAGEMAYEHEVVAACVTLNGLSRDQAPNRCAGRYRYSARPRC